MPRKSLNRYEGEKIIRPRKRNLSNPGTEATPIYKHVELGPDFTKWFPELRAMEADINNAVDMSNEVAKLKAILDSEEVQRALKLQVAYATARDNFLAKRARLLAAVQGMNDLLQGKAMELYHQAFDAYDEAILRMTEDREPEAAEDEPQAVPEPKKEI